MRPILVLLASAAAPTICPAAIVYDNIRTPYSFYTGTFSSATNTGEMGQDVLLAGGQGVTLETVTLLLRASTLPYNGPVWVGLYTNSAAQPGTLIASSSSPVQLAAQETLPVSFDFTGVDVPAAVWVSFRYESQPVVGIAAGLFPTVGSTQGRQAVRTFGTGQWFVSNATGFGIRITSVPTPGAATIPLAGLFLARRRRC